MFYNSILLLGLPPDSFYAKWWSKIIKCLGTPRQIVHFNEFLKKNSTWYRLYKVHGSKHFCNQLQVFSISVLAFITTFDFNFFSICETLACRVHWILLKPFFHLLAQYFPCHLFPHYPKHNRGNPYLILAWCSFLQIFLPFFSKLRYVIKVKHFKFCSNKHCSKMFQAYQGFLCILWIIFRKSSCWQFSLTDNFNISNHVLWIKKNSPIHAKIYSRFLHWSVGSVLQIWPNWGQF